MAPRVMFHLVGWYSDIGIWRLFPWCGSTPMHSFPCGRVMGCPIAMGTNICRLLGSLVLCANFDRKFAHFVVARVPRIQLHGFVIDLRVPGSNVGIVQRTVLCRRCTSVHSLTIPIVSLVPVSCGARVPTSGLGAIPKTSVFRA